MNAYEAGFTVLVADDSPVSRALVQSVLKPRQYTVLVATNGSEALDLFARHRPAMVITDWLMPDLSGIELCQRIRAESADSYTYLILLTGVVEKDKIVKGLEAGADDYLTKPFHADELVARVRAGRRIVELQRELEAKSRWLEQLALTDALTGLPNRRAIEDWAARQLKGAARHDYFYWIVMADLDRFKSVNDTLGHEAGDAVLKRFAEILRTHLRKSNNSGRFGGEEFLLVLTHTNADGVRLVVDRIRQQFSGTQFFFGGQSLVVTASFGAAGFLGRTAPDLHHLLAEADRALYLAKSNGRNRLEIIPPATQ